MKTKVVEIEGKKVTVWKMNFGFRSDYQGETTQTKISSDNNKRKKEVTIDNGKVILMTLVYGIFESSDLNIPQIQNLELGFTPEEKEHRLRIIRSLEIDTEKIFDAINELNTEPDEQVIKK
jgi:hypothetical protein